MTRPAAGVMAGILGALLATAPLAAMPRSYAGVAARYRPGLMEQVARRRGVSAPAGACLIASPYEPLGARVLVQSRVRETARLCVVVDVAHPADRPAIIRRRIVVELRHEDARLLCGSVVEPPRQCPVIVTRQ